MLCLKSEALELDNDHDLYALVVAPININFGSMIYRYLRRRRKTTCNSSTSRLSSDASDALNSCNKTQDGESDDETPRNICRYKFQLQQDVNQLKRELQEEIGVHLALADAIHQSATSPSSISLSSLPPKVLDLLSNVAMLEITVSKLEKELASLHFQLTQERNERRLAQYRLQHFSPSPPPPPIWLSRSYIEDKDGEMEIVGLLQGTLKDDSDDKHSYIETLGNHPNWLSEEMVRCMRNIFLCLAHSSNPFSDSPHPHISHSFVATLSGSSVMDEFTESTHDMRYDTQVSEKEKMVDPYQVQGKVINSMRDIGSYSKVAEVSWMSVGEKQLEYAATALKRFRLLVEQLAKVNPACMSHSERLAFWINLYNALMMHAYLAYGVPRSDMNFFSFMQKAAYTVGGHSFNALDIEYVILKIRPPTHRPQMALLLALHKFKIPEDQRKYSIEKPEPLVEFALSCGMRSSPAIRIFKAANVADDLKDSLRDYIQASVGLSNKGKLLVPKLLHSYAKGIVEDASLPEWICQYICPEQAAVVRDNLSRRKQRLLRTRSFAVLPFDSQFRYLFLPDLNQDRQVQIEAKFLLVDPSKQVIPHPLKHQRVHGGLNLQICNSK